MNSSLELPKSIKDMIISRSVPSFVTEEHPMFVTFLDAFYEWLESEQTFPNSLVSNLQQLTDVDRTLDIFFESFRSKFLSTIPDNILADKALLVKQIRKFYLNKGNEQSFKFLFRLLYNEDISFYYPKVDILRVSDGKWYEQKSIKITLTDPDNFVLFSNRRIQGVTSGTTANVEFAVRYIQRGVDIVELSLVDISGNFTSDETIRIFYYDDLTKSEVFIEETILDIFTEVEVITGGSGYSQNDIFPVKDSLDNVIGSATVITVGTGQISGLSIVEPGTGYNGEYRNITIFGGLTVLNEIYGMELGDICPYDVLDSSGDMIADFTVLSTVPSALVFTGNGDLIQVFDSSSGNGAGSFGIVTIVGDFGDIQEIELLSSGTNYSTPFAEVVSDTGTGGEVSVSGGGGAVQKVRLQAFPPVLPSIDLDSNGDSTVLVDTSGFGNANADLQVNIGTLGLYQGRYLNDDGHLSSTKKLQDNRYYQDYSYVINSSVDISKWENIIKELLHPAGLRLFGAFILSYNMSRVPVIESLEEIQTVNAISNPAEITYYTVETTGGENYEFNPIDFVPGEFLITPP